MSAPVGRRGLVFRHAYNGPFWHLETRSARWDWEVARKRFAPEKINGTEAGNFFEKWRAKLVPNNGLKQENGDFIYMPLQGKLLRHRSFQQASPLEMIKATLQYTDLPIQATLHPSENYTDDEIDALEIIQSNENRFKVTNLQMHDALASCRFVVSENSSAAFHAVLYEKPSVLFAKIDFNHICFQFDPMKPEKVFQDVSRNRPRFQEYLFWYWSKNCINLDSDDACQDIVQRMSFLGWPLSKLQHE